MENIISNNVVTSGGKQNNSVLDFCLRKDVHLNFFSRPTHSAAIQDFGSPVDTVYSYRRLNELVTSFNSGDIEAKRFHGQNIYESRTGRIMTMFGHVQHVSMDDMIKVDGEGSTILCSIIACLSIPMTKTALSSTVASAFVLNMHGSIDSSMEGIIQMVQAKVAKYAGSILSRDVMCNKLENTKEEVLRLIKTKAPHIRHESLFLPPFNPPEEQDFVAFIVKLWASKADGQVIYTRSVKLLALSLMLSDYGWYIDVFVEREDSNSDGPTLVPIKQDTGAFSVIYSSVLSPDSDRVYVENHEKYYLSRAEPYASSICKTVHMGETSGLSLSRTNRDQQAFMRGYEAMDEFCKNRLAFKVTVSIEGRIKVDIEGSPLSPSMGCRAFLAERFMVETKHELILDLAAGVLSCLFPDYDWALLDESIRQWPHPQAPCTTLLIDSPPDCQQIWAATGAVLAMLDRIVVSIVNITDASLIRTLAGYSISVFIQKSGEYLTPLLNGGPGLEPSLAVKFCAARLAGLNPDRESYQHYELSRVDMSRVIGYWNGQQGLLLTPIYERHLYSDLSDDKALPLTFHNIPIMGMVTDERGWIRSGLIHNAFNRRRTFPTKTPRPCDVVIEYRPHFEQDSRSVVAVVYLDGVFHNVYALSETLSTLPLLFSSCSHPIDTKPQRALPKLITLDSLQPGETSIPRDEVPHMIVPQGTALTRWFCTLAYRSFCPVIQNGCLDCAVAAAEKEQTVIIIPIISQ
ncbi:hypothetical protein F66182_934 [Fusarium sp. NRRL 66182]|nr:hypothetical protein F66182_934 [Fusarium sp. NRRL 66182]